MIVHRGYAIFATYPCPPIPMRCYDYTWVLESQKDDGPDIDPDETGFGVSVEDCREQIDELLAEREED